MSNWREYAEKNTGYRMESRRVRIRVRQRACGEQACIAGGRCESASNAESSSGECRRLVSSGGQHRLGGWYVPVLPEHPRIVPGTQLLRGAIHLLVVLLMMFFWSGSRRQCSILGYGILHVRGGL